jgi:hypothetical protein
MLQNGPTTAAAGCLIGCARVSTENRGTDRQRDELLAAGCATVRKERLRCRPQPAGAGASPVRCPACETLLVVRLDRLRVRSAICSL